MVALIAEGEGDTVPYVVAVNPAAQDLGLRANELVKQLRRRSTAAAAERLTWRRARARTRPASTRRSTALRAEIAGAS